MEKRKLISTLLFIFCFVVTGCDTKVQPNIKSIQIENTQNESINNEQIEEIELWEETEYIEYENKKNNFKIQIPNNWTFQEEIDWFNIEIKTPKNDSINENLGIIVQELQTKQTLESYTESTIKWLTDLYESYNEIDKQNIEINSIKGLILTYELSENWYEIKAQQAVLLDDNKAYVFQYTATKDTFNQYINEINYILNSFNILN